MSSLKQYILNSFRIILALLTVLLSYCLGWSLYGSLVDQMHVLARGWNLLAIPIAFGMNYLLFPRKIRCISWIIFVLLLSLLFKELRWYRPYFLFESIVTVGSVAASVVLLYFTRKKESPILHWKWWKKVLFAIAVFLSPFCFNTINSYDRQSERGKEIEEDTFVSNQIIGNFTGSGSDTIWFNHSSIEAEYVQDTLYFSFPVKNPIYPYYYWCSRLINEGDLDGDGLDEFGFAYTVGMSNWFSYQVYSIRDGYLCRLSEKNHINHSDVIYDSLAESTGIRNKIKLKNAEAVWGDHDTRSDWLGWEYRDTIVDANYEIVEEIE